MAALAMRSSLARLPVGEAWAAQVVDANEIVIAISGLSAGVTVGALPTTIRAGFIAVLDAVVALGGLAYSTITHAGGAVCRLIASGVV